MDVQSFCLDFVQAVAIEGCKALAVLSAFVVALVAAIMLSTLIAPASEPEVERVTPMCSTPEYVKPERNEILRI